MSQTKAQLISDLVQALNFTGTASAPANGLFLSAANTLKLATASTERLKIDGTEVVVNDTGASVDFRVEGDTDANLLFVDASADKVGIGTSSPHADLHVQGDGTNAEVNIWGGTLGRSKFNLKATDTGSAGTFQLTTESTVPSAPELITVTNAGNVGIGTTSPRSLLDLGSGSGDGSLSTTLSQYQIMLEAPQGANDYGRNIGWSVGTNGLVAAINAVDVGGDDATGLTFITGNNTAASERMRLDSNGRLMIGTTTPGAVLSLDNTGQDTQSLIQCKDAGGSGAHSHIILQNTTGDVATINTVGDNLEFRVDDATVFSDLSGGEHMRIDSSGRLGIGATNPASDLHIESSTPGLRLSDTDNSSAFCLFDGNGANLNIHADKGNTVDNTTIGFGIDNSIKMLLTSTGRLGINNNSPADIPATSHDTVVVGNSTMTSGGVVLHGAADTSGNLGYQFYKGGSFPCARVLYEGSSNELQFHSTSTAAGSAPANESRKVRILPGGNVVIDNGDLVVASGHGIDFSATGEASGMGSELLDDYEEGTWTPVYVFGTTNNTATYDVQTGMYTKIGRMVYVSYAIRSTNINNSTGPVVIGGLPFSSTNTPIANISTNGVFPIQGFSFDGEFISQQLSGFSIELYGVSKNANGNMFDQIRDTDMNGTGNAFMKGQICYNVS